MRTNPPRLEHVNITVSNSRKTAQMLADLFGWTVRWEGPSKLGGHSVHVGTEDHYLAVYSPADPASHDQPKGYPIGALNHLGVLVDDLDNAEERVKALGFSPFNHGDYEPGRRFYFLDQDGIEYEIVSYQS